MSSYVICARYSDISAGCHNHTDVELHQSLAGQFSLALLTIKGRTDRQWSAARALESSMESHPRPQDTEKQS